VTYFNDNDPFTLEWCRNAFPEAEFDARSILDIERPTVAVRQHYFAGLGGWEWALRLAEWPDDWEVWTGSCPCQPFSVAGKRQAHEDERDLWPAFFRLIALRRPAAIVGEQVGHAIAYGWLDRICDDLEGIGYAVGAAVLPACGVGAPHIRQRLYWVALAQGVRSDPPAARSRPSSACDLPSSPIAGGLEDADRSGLEGYVRDGGDSSQSGRIVANQAGSAWAASTLIYCRDGRWRRIPLERGLQPLVDGGRFGNPRVDPHLSSRIGALKAAGNMICIPLATEFIRAVMETSHHG